MPDKGLHKATTEGLEQKLRSRLQDHSSAPPDFLWANIREGVKTGAKGSGTIGGGTLLSWITGAVLVSSLVAIGYFGWTADSGSEGISQPALENMSSATGGFGQADPGGGAGNSVEQLAQAGTTVRTNMAFRDTLKVVSVEIERRPAHGSLEYDKAGLRFSYVPNKDFFGADSFTYIKVYQDASRSQPLLVRVLIEPEVFVRSSFTSSPVTGKTILFTQQSQIESVDPSIRIPDSMIWDFGDGQTSREPNPRHTYLKDGDYSVCLTTYARGQSGTSCQSLSLLKGNSVQITGTARGKSNQQLSIEPNTQGKLGRSLDIPVELNFPDLRFILRSSGKGIIDTTGAQGNPTSFNNQPVKKK